MTLELVPPSAILPLRLTDGTALAKEMMDDFAVAHLPLIDADGHLLGQVSRPMMNRRVKSLAAFVPELLQARGFAQMLMNEAVGLMHQNRLTVLPLVNNDEQYEGCIALLDVLSVWARMAATAIPGGIIVLEVGLHSYSLSEIARLAESNNARILSCSISSPSDALNIEVTLKLDAIDLNPILATYERFNYHIVTYMVAPGVPDYFADRYNALMRYLNT